MARGFGSRGHVWSRKGVAAKPAAVGAGGGVKRCQLGAKASKPAQIRVSSASGCLVSILTCSLWANRHSGTTEQGDDLV